MDGKILLLFVVLALVGIAYYVRTRGLRPHEQHGGDSARSAQPGSPPASPASPASSGSGGARRR